MVVAVLFGVAVVVVALAAWSAANVIRARHDLLIGKSEAESALTETTPSDLEQAAPVPALRAASAQFHHARSLLDAPPLVPLRFFPLLGRQIDSARALSLAGAEAADVSSQGLTELKQLLATRSSTGADRVSQLKQALTVASRVDTKLSALHYGPRQGLISQLANAHNELVKDVTKVVTSLDKTVAAGHSLVDLLSGQHQVLVMATSNAETRAGSGIVGEIGVLQVNDGAFVLGNIQSVNDYPVPAGAVADSPSLEARWGWLHPTDDWDEILDSPRFNVAAPAAAKMWIAAGQGPVDSVLAIDPVFLSEVVNVIGPITVGTQTYTAAQVESTILNTQYVQNTARALRQDFFGQIAQATFAKVDAGGWSLPAMFQALATAADGRHLLIWSQGAADEAGWVRCGAAGVLTPQSLMVNILNRGRNKLDWYLATAATLSVGERGDDTLVTVTVKLDDTTPPGLTGEIVGTLSGNFEDLYPGQVLNYGDYLGIVDISAPGAAADLGMLGVSQPPIDGPDGPTNVVGAQYIIRDGTTTTVTFTFTMPGHHGSLTVEPDGRYPAMTWTSPLGNWTGDHEHIISW